MRPMLTAILIAAILLVTAPFVFAEENDPRLNLGRSVGAAGELGPYQICPSVWLQFSEKPVAWSYGRHPAQMAEQDRVAGALVEWINTRLRSLHLPHTARSIGLVWTAGYGNMRAGNYGRAKKQYAERVQNVYSDKTQEVSP